MESLVWGLFLAEPGTTLLKSGFCLAGIWQHLLLSGFCTHWEGEN